MVELLELVDLSNEEIPVTVGHLGVSNMDHVVIDVEVQLENGRNLLVIFEAILPSFRDFFKFGEKIFHVLLPHLNQTPNPKLHGYCILLAC